MAMSYCGTPLNMTPQALDNTEYDISGDVWALGIIVYELFCGFPPFTGYSKDNLAYNVRKGNWGVPKNVKMSLSCLDFINKCLQFEPKSRIRANQLLDHPFIKDEISEETLSLKSSVFQDNPFEMLTGAD
jgi:serine/threonine protein kinase